MTVVLIEMIRAEDDDVDDDYDVGLKLRMGIPDPDAVERESHEATLQSFTIEYVNALPPGKSIYLSITERKMRQLRTRSVPMYVKRW